MNAFFVIDSQADRRAEVCRVLLAGDGHAEPFDTIEEFLAFSRSQGLALGHNEGGAATRLCEMLGDDPRLVPVIGYEEAPALGRVVAAMQAGASSYLEWPFTLKSFMGEIERIEPLLGQGLDRKRRTARARSLLSGLTAREREVLVSLTSLGTNKAIAKHLDISPRTVEKYRAAILVRLGVENTAQAIRIAAEGGAFDDETGAALVGDAARPVADDDLIG